MPSVRPIGKRMATFYLTLRVVPTLKNPDFNDVAGASALCWIYTDNPQSALARASFKVRQYEWDVVEVQDPPTETTQNDFVEKDIGLEQYKHAQENGIAIVFAAWARDGKSSYGPVKLKRLDDFDLALYLSESKKLKQQGHCLHYDAGSRCSQVIDAHSIQRNGALSLIADNGHVYAISRNFQDLKRGRGGVTYTKQGINTVSTFRGFCEKHDIELFAPIDAASLIPTQQQTLLYAYRALCRELFVKENASRLLKKQAEKSRGQAALYKLLDSMREGTDCGLRNLLSQKRRYDESLSAGSFSDIKSVVFCTHQKPSLVFSGLFYPDFDFLGRQLQDLSDHSTALDLLTFSFAPMDDGWGIVFAWHSQSSGACVPFMKSLATRIYEDGKPEDHLFRLVISNCENMAVRPQWWESLPEQVRIAIKNAASYGADLFAPIRPDYLAQGLYGVSSWKFENVISDME